MNDADRLRWARALSYSGWMFVFAYLGYVTWQVRRAFTITEGSFEDGLWWQRIETISFVTLPQNLIVLVPGAAAAVGGAVLYRQLVDPPINSVGQLVRVVAGLGYVVAALAVLGIIGIFFRNPDTVGDVAAFIRRLGGLTIALAIIRLCLEAENTPAGPAVPAAD